MNWWTHLLANSSVTPRIVHRLPGRLRVHIPALAKIPDAWQTEGDGFADLFNTVSGVESITPSYVTGNLLIHFDPKCIDEKQILDRLHQIGLLLLQHREELQSMSAESPSAVFKKMEKLLREQMEHV